MKKKAGPTRTASTPRKSPAVGKTGAAQAAPASPGGKRRGAPKAFSAAQVPVTRSATTRAPLYETHGAACRELYVTQRLHPGEIARRTGVKESTVRTWARRYGWDAARQSALEGPAAMVEDVAAIFKSFVQAATDEARKGKLPNEKFWDNLIKGSAAIERLSGDAHFAAHMTKFVDGLLKYTSANRPDLLPAISELLSGYSTTVLSSR